MSLHIHREPGDLWERMTQGWPGSIHRTCKKNHSKAPAGVPQDAASQDYLLVAEGVLAVLPGEDPREPVQLVVRRLTADDPCKIRRLIRTTASSLQKPTVLLTTLFWIPKGLSFSFRNHAVIHARLCWGKDKLQHAKTRQKHKSIIF